MNKRRAKKEACYIAAMCLQHALSTGDAGEDEKIEDAFRELIEEMYRRADYIVDEQQTLLKDSIDNGRLRSW